MNTFQSFAASVLIGGLLGAAPAVAQQTLILNGGQVMHGRYDGGNADTIFFIDEHGNRNRFNISEIQDLRFSGQSAERYESAPAMMPPAGYPPPAAQYNPQSAPAGRYSDQDTPANNNWNRSATIPAGSEMVVRTVDRIDSSAADPNRRFYATMERDVRDSSGNIVIPRGAPAHLVVRPAGEGRVAIDLRSVNVNGQRFVLDTADLTNAREREGLGANSRTGKYVGGGAILGGILGAAVGGGTGALVGAAAGAGAGAAAEVATSGPRVHIPSETVLRFRLDHPVYLYQ
jgi:hypothetical protein